MDTSTNSHSETGTSRFERPAEGRVIGGVAAALANRTNTSVGLIRIAFVVAALFGGFGLVLYVAAWALLPGEGEAESAAERWLENLTTPGKRIGALLIGVAGLIILIGAAPVTALAAVALLAGIALLADQQQPATDVTVDIAAPSESE